LIISSLLTIFPAVNELSLEEQVGQLLIAHFHGSEVNEEARVLIEEAKVGGILYYEWANDLSSPEQVRSLSAGLRALAAKTRMAIPPLLAIDQEGGLVQRLRKGFTIFPGNAALGIVDDLHLTKECALAMGKELLAVGITFNLAPVADLQADTASSIGIRSFGSSVERVTAHVQAALEGFREAGVLTSLKHFPGHGRIQVDSHEELPVLPFSAQELQEKDLIPFLTLASQADTVMTGHILVPGIDKTSCATLSKPILDIIRGRCITPIISDSLIMEGLLYNCQNVQEAAIRALLAGCDIVLLGGKQLLTHQQGLELTVQDVCKVHQAIVLAVEEGRIPYERIQEAAQRVLQLKKQQSLLSNPMDFSSSQHEQLARQIAQKALQGGWEGAPLTLMQQSLYFCVPQILQESFVSTSSPLINQKETALGYFSLVPSQEEATSILRQAKSADVIIFCSYNAWKDPNQQKLITELRALQKTTIFIALRDSIDLDLYPEAACKLSTSSPTTPSIQAALDFLLSQ